jgi:Na+-driven multidrug efflux pump
MCLAAALRAAGHAKRSMYAITSGGIVNAILDPIFIFGLDLGIQSGAWASVLARITIFVMACPFLIRNHTLLKKPSLGGWLNDLPRIFNIAGPAMLTNLATPIGGSYATKSMAVFGDDAVAGAAIIGRLVSVGFCGLFALSSAIGPIFGQNIGAKLYQRVRQVLFDAIKFIGVYVLLIWIIFFSLQDLLVHAFDADQKAAYLIKSYCTWIMPGFFFNGLLFSANAAFNNMNAAYLATLFNFLKNIFRHSSLCIYFCALFWPCGRVSWRSSRCHRLWEFGDDDRLLERFKT